MDPSEDSSVDGSANGSSESSQNGESAASSDGVQATSSSQNPSQGAAANTPSSALKSNSKPSTPTKNESAKEAAQNAGHASTPVRGGVGGAGAEAPPPKSSSGRGHRKNIAMSESPWERLSASRGTRGHSRNSHRQRDGGEVQNKRLGGGSKEEGRQRVRTRSQRDEEAANEASSSPHMRAAANQTQAQARSPSPQEEPAAEPAQEAVPQEGPPPSAEPPAQVPYNWQASKPSLRERLMFIYNTEAMADIHFIVGRDAQRIPAHKFILCVGSAVFDAMFNGAMAVTSGEVELPDVEPSAFLALLRFLYSDEVLIGPETVMTTLYTAKKYAVPALEQACVEFLKKNLSTDNALLLLTQARLFDEPQLAAFCLETIDKSTSEAITADGFTDIDLDTLKTVLERDTLGIREVKLFKAVCRWAEAECNRRNLEPEAANQRQVLGEALRLVRFPLMTVEEFAMEAAQTGLLLDKEVVELFLYFTVDPKPPVSFSDVPRCCLTGKEQVVSRFVHIEHRWGYSGTSDRIR